MYSSMPGVHATSTQGGMTNEIFIKVLLPQLGCRGDAVGHRAGWCRCTTHQPLAAVQIVQQYLSPLAYRFPSGAWKHPEGGEAQANSSAVHGAEKKRCLARSGCKRCSSE